MRIIKVPSNCGGLSKRDGVELAPDLIESELKSFYLKENGIYPNLQLSCIEIDNSLCEESFKKIQESVKYPAILLGGDHSITYPAYMAFASANSGLVVFDAHADCENSFRPPTHEDYLRVLLDDGVLNPQNVILVGLRNIHIKELEFLKRNRIKHFDMREIMIEGINETSDAVMSAARRFEKLYVSVDIDAVDPAFAPGTGYPEPGGLSSRQLIFFLQRLRMLKNFSAADIVEVNPKKDINNITVKLAAKIAVELC